MQFHSARSPHGFDCSLTAGYFPPDNYYIFGITQLSATTLYQYWPKFIPKLYLGVGGGISINGDRTSYSPREDKRTLDWYAYPFLSQCVGYEFNKTNKNIIPFIQAEINPPIPAFIFIDSLTDLIYVSSPSLYCGIRF
jgi:hypothetical protein